MQRWRRFERAQRRREVVTAAADGRSTRRKVVGASTVVVGGGVLAWALRLAPGDRLFYPATLGLAAVWAAGDLAAGPTVRNHPTATPPTATVARRVGLGVATGGALLGVFLVGGAGISMIPVLRTPVDRLLDHVRWGSLPAVLAVTLLNGVVEERFFRGALYDAFGGRGAMVGTTVVYTAVTAMAGVPLLALAGLALGAVVVVLRRTTGGLAAPIAAHLTWSTGMLVLLPPLLDLLETP